MNSGCAEHSKHESKARNATERQDVEDTQAGNEQVWHDPAQQCRRVDDSDLSGVQHLLTARVICIYRIKCECFV